MHLNGSNSSQQDRSQRAQGLHWGKVNLDTIAAVPLHAEAEQTPCEAVETCIQQHFVLVRPSKLNAALATTRAGDYNRRAQRFEQQVAILSNRDTALTRVCTQYALNQ